MPFDAGEIKGRLTIDKSQWDKSAKQIKASQQKMAAQTKKTGSAFKGMWKQMAVGMGVTTLVTSGVRGLLRQMGDTIKVGRAFEKEWANVTTMLSVSRLETEKMKHELQMISPTLGSTTELAKGMYQVLSASIEPAKAIEFLGTAAKSAKAGVTETKIAVDALTTVINAYGMEAEKASDISDIMFATVKRGKLTYGELATSLGTVIPVAATVGVEFEEVAAAVATLTRQGVIAQKATMQLRQVMMAILKPSEAAKQLAEDLGIELGASAVKAKGLSGFLSDLKEKTKGNADLMAKLVPNVRALTAVMALAGKASKGYAYDQEFMRETMGFTDEAFRKQMESVDFWVETFEIATDKIKEAIYEGLTSQLRESIRTSEDFDEKVTQATNNAANAVSLHVGGMVEMFGMLKDDVNRQLAPLRFFADKIFGATKRADELTEAEERLAESIAKAGYETGITTEETEGLKEEVGQAALKVKDLYDRWEQISLFDMDLIWESLTPPSELMARWDEFYNLVETPELDLIWEQQMGNMEQDTLNFMGSIIPGMQFMTKSATDDIKKMGKDTKVSFGQIAGDVGTALHMIGSKNKAVATATAIINTAQAVSKALSEYPPPLSFVMAALQGAAGLAEVLTIKNQPIPSAEKGAYLPSPAIIEAGHGPKGEIILPIDRAPLSEITQPISEGAKIDFNFYAPIISTVGLSDRDVDEAAEYFLQKMRDEIERYGGKLNA